ncbi:hypothetical protein [Pseudobdellovibrio sp. HCB154]|uniref:hypothetical protein n=1 Tax=Pseudobdellovibrio sp. HCB154 TaxID=3386277 RepID=UPI0039175EB0
MKVLVFALLFLTSLAQAKIESNYTLTPTAGQSEFLPGINLAVANIEFKNNAGDLKGIGLDLSAKYFYGLTDFLSVGLEVSHQNMRTEINAPNTNTQTTKGKGFADPVVRAKGNLDVADLGVFYSIAYGFATQKSKYNFDSDEYTMASGQNSYQLEAGVAVPVNEYLIGGHINYTKNLKGKETHTTNGIDSEVDLKESTSHRLKIYMEFQKQYHLTGAFVHQRQTDLYQGLEFSARFDTSSQSEIIPQVTSLVVKHPEDLNADIASVVYFGATFRYLF